jgi:sulfite exporter TauE/SafE
MSDQYLAFMIGILGSVHCVGMCGPLAFSVPSLRTGLLYQITDKVLYQLGRVLSYTILGALIGLIGTQLWMSGLQQVLSLTTGFLIILAACSRLFKFKTGKNGNYLLKPFNAVLGYALRQRANHLIIGMINGLLPCGFVYLALAAAVNTPSVTSAAGYMFWFGLGTSPLMFLAVFTMGFSRNLFRVRINKAIPYFMLLLGVWFVLRGMDLNIPYLSPSKPVSAAVHCG